MYPTKTDLFTLAGEAVALFMRSAPDREVHLTANSWLVISGEPLADFNNALVDEGPRADAQLRDYGEILRRRGMPALLFLTDSVADSLAPTASELGMQQVGKVPFMGCSTGGDFARTNGFQIRRVESSQEFSVAIHLQTKAFGFPPGSVERVLLPAMLDGPGLSMFVAWDGGVPVCTVTTTQVGGVVGVWAMATPLEHQRKGAGRALLQHALSFHRDRGASYFYLWATDAGLRLYEQAGFRTVTELSVWASGHSTQVSSH